MEKEMCAKLCLEVGAITFILKEVDFESKFIHFEMKLELLDKFSWFKPTKNSCNLDIEDVGRLVSYIRKHCKRLINKEKDQQLVFFPCLADFQIDFFTGDIEDMSNGIFTLGLKFNCGKAIEEASNNYFGFESIVDVVDIDTFCNEFDEIYIKYKDKLKL